MNAPLPPDASTITVMSCPFCGHDDVQIDEVDMNCYAVCCPECECIGPVSRISIEESVELWNLPHSQSLKLDRLVREAREGAAA